jgi:hypothetical protein
VANSHRKCKYKECGEFYRVADGLKDFCSEDHKVLQFKSKPKAKPAVKKKRVKLKTLPRLIEECAVTLQRLVRVKAAVAANNNGYIKCVTCSKVDHFNNLQGGHFIERGKVSVKLVEEQIWPQCGQCNKWNMKKASYILAYRSFLADTYGEQWVKDLELQSKQTKKYTRSEVETIHNDYKARLDALEIEL